MIRVFEAQRLVSLTTLFDLADNLDSVSRGEKLNTALAGRLATRITEIQLPRTPSPAKESSALAFGYWTERHVDAQRKLNLRAAIEKAASDPQKLKDVRGQLAPFLRDTLVGFNYIHYAPPGAQVLHTNPLFVRSHDFIGSQDARDDLEGGRRCSAPAGRRMRADAWWALWLACPTRWPRPKQNFLIPTQEQALIWGDLVPQMIVSAVVPRWWNVTPAATPLGGHDMAYAEALLAEAALNGVAEGRCGSRARTATHRRPGLRRSTQLLAAGEVQGQSRTLCPPKCTCWRRNWRRATTNRRSRQGCAAWRRRIPRP